ncbi:AAA family ATPase [Candidatus Parvarchaeota archaeon]|nr:AAA family ATPase [Candidatus Parvarchaeota archaeon]
MPRKLSPSLENFVENYSGSIKNKVINGIRSGEKRFIFNGPSGSGKTFLAEAMANSMGLPFQRINVYTLENVEDLNISDIIFNTVYNAAVSSSLLQANGKLILIEDLEKVLSVDPSILSKLGGIENSIIIFESSSGEIFRSKYKKSLQGYEIIRFYRLNERIMTVYAKKILALNGMSLNDGTVARIVKNAKGNINSMMSDIYTLYITGSIETGINDRYSENTIFELINRVLLSKNPDRVLDFSTDGEAKNFEIWLSEKLPQVFHKDKLFLSYDAISFCDMLLMKIRKQNWGLLKYINFILFDAINSLYTGENVNIDFSAPNWNAYYSS